MNQNDQDPSAQYDEQEYAEDEVLEEDAENFSDEDSQVVRQLPWMGIALVVHALGLFIAAFIISYPPEPPPLEVLKSTIDEAVAAEIPEKEEQPEVEFPKDEPPVEDPTVDPKITEQAVDDHNEDPTDSPLNELAENPNADDSQAESPNPNKGPSSAFGLAGGGGGGGGRGGRGGSVLKRARGGGGKPHADRVDAALRWLADHQNNTGYWSAQNFIKDSKRIAHSSNIAVTGTIDFLKGTPDTGWATGDMGMTGLALLAFAGNGNTHTEGEYFQNVQAGLNWLISVQDDEGSWGPRSEEETWTYTHAICTMAVAEILEMSGDTKNLRAPAQRAVNFIVNSQNDGLGWRYGVKPGDNDSSVTAWMVLALKSCKLAGLNFPHEQVYKGANAWYDEATGKDDAGYLVTGYNYKASPNSRFEDAGKIYDRNPSMDACCVMARLYTGHATKQSELSTQSARILGYLPAWNPDDQKSLARVDMYYWYYASLALYQLGGQQWDTWEKALINPIVIKYQRGFHPKDVEQFGQRVTSTSKGDDGGRWILDEHGSWDPVDPWGSAGGRVYSTAIQVLTLEVYYRYNRILAEKGKH